MAVPTIVWSSADSNSASATPTSTPAIWPRGRLLRLVIVTPDAEGFRAYISRHLPELAIAIAPSDDLRAAQALVREADMLLAWKLPPDLLTEAPRLRWVQSFGAGVDYLLAANVPA